MFATGEKEYLMANQSTLIGLTETSTRIWAWLNCNSSLPNDEAKKFYNFPSSIHVSVLNKQSAARYKTVR